MKSSSCKDKRIKHLLSILLFFILLFTIPSHTGFCNTGTETELTPLSVSGDWLIMGIRYGTEKSKEIRNNFELAYEAWSKKPFGDDYLIECLNHFIAETENLSPQLFSLIVGISGGAGDSLNSSKYCTNLSNLQKIMLLNTTYEMLANDFWHLQISNNGYCATYSKNFAGKGIGWISGPGTNFSNDTICVLLTDYSYSPLKHYETVRFAPKDGSNTFFFTAPAGSIATDSALNSLQVFTGMTHVGNTYNPGKKINENAFGVPSGIMPAYISAFCNNTEDAYTALSSGNEYYREKTGNKTLIPTIGCNFIITDPSKAIVVERTANHFYMKAYNKNSLYNKNIIISNYFNLSDSFNKDGRRTRKSMSHFGTGVNNKNDANTKTEKCIIGFAKQKGKKLTTLDIKIKIFDLFTPERNKWEKNSYVSGNISTLSLLSMEYSFQNFSNQGEMWKKFILAP